MDSKHTNLEDKPLWLIDIDGVLNAYKYSRRKPNTWLWGEEVHNLRLVTDYGIFAVWVAEGLVRFLSDIHASGLVDMQWCTTWADEANTVFAPAFNLPELPVAAHPDETILAWKHRAAIDASERGRRLIWTDDDAIDKGAKLKVKNNLANHSHLTVEKDLLLIIPNPKVGLTPADCRSIAAFVGFDTTL